MGANGLSPEMQRAVKFAKAYGNKLIRHPGGFWGAERLSVSFGTSTVEALVTRGIGVYSQWFENQHGRRRFPIEMKLMEK